MTAEIKEIKDPVFLLGAHKSGTSLLRSLLDSHSKLFVVPIEMHFFKCMGFWIDYRMQSSWPEKLDTEGKREKLLARIERKINNSNPYSDSVLPNALDLETFDQYLQTHAPETMSEFFSVYTHALYQSLTGRELSPDIRVVEKSVENAEYAAMLKKLFPSSKFIHIVRNPYSTLVSIRKSKTKNARYPYLGGITQSLENSYCNLHKNTALLDDYKIIRYEDLLTSNQSQMEEIATFLDIDFEDSLLNPTLLGKGWGGNSTSNKAFSDVSLSPLTAWEKEITNLEVHLVNHFLLPAVEELEYSPISTSQSYLVPIRNEGPVTYVKNRSFIKLLSKANLGSP